MWEGGREATGQQVGHSGDPYKKAIQLSLWNVLTFHLVAHGD